MVVKAKINQLLWWLEGLRQEVMDEVFWRVMCTPVIWLHAARSPSYL